MDTLQPIADHFDTQWESNDQYPEWQGWVIQSDDDVQPILKKLERLPKNYKGPRIQFMQEEPEAYPICTDINKSRDMCHLMAMHSKNRPKANAMVDYCKDKFNKVPAWLATGRNCDSLYASILEQLPGVPKTYTPRMLKLQMVDMFSKSYETVEVNTYNQ